MSSNLIPFRPLRRAQPPPGHWLEIYRQFWRARLTRLTDYLTSMQSETTMDDLKILAPAGQPTMTLTRTLNAPRTLVWKAVSEPEHLVRWWGPHGLKNEVLLFDFMVGGKWRIKTINTPGQTIIFHGEFREILKPETITQTFGMEGMFGDAYSVDTLTLEDRGATTIYRVVSTLPDVASRDGMIASGMEKGVREGFERLDEMLEEFKSLA